MTQTTIKRRRGKQTKTCISWKPKKLFRRNKKHFSQILKDFMLNKYRKSVEITFNIPSVVEVSRILESDWLRPKLSTSGCPWSEQILRKADNRRINDTSKDMFYMTFALSTGLITYETVTANVYIIKIFYT